VRSREWRDIPSLAHPLELASTGIKQNWVINRTIIMDKTQALQNLLTGAASEEEVSLLQGGLASMEVSIGRNVNQSVIISRSVTKNNSDLRSP
jgi:hypothetical protein